MEARRLCPLENPKRKKITWDEIRWSRRLLEISPVVWTMATNPAVSDNIISIYFKFFSRWTFSSDTLYRPTLFPLHRQPVVVNWLCHRRKLLALWVSRLNCLRNARWTVTTDLQISNCKTQNAFYWGVAIFVIIVARETKQRKAILSLAQLKLSSFLFHLSLHTTFYASSEW